MLFKESLVMALSAIEPLREALEERERARII